jgi:hypothetical protein
MSQLSQMQGVMNFTLWRFFHPHQGHSGGLAARVEFRGHRLNRTGRTCAIFEPDREGHQPVDDCSLTMEQQSCAPL